AEAAATAGEDLEDVPFVEGVEGVGVDLLRLAARSGEGEGLDDPRLPTKEADGGRLGHEAAAVGGARDAVGQHAPAVPHAQAATPLTATSTVGEVLELLEQVRGVELVQLRVRRAQPTEGVRRRQVVPAVEALGGPAAAL